ncbi:MAG: hypothetical protein KAS39_01320 [Actinomycetia bacterium]|nr:hypothetical protein [Actinomycetes bacterium]
MNIMVMKGILEQFLPRGRDLNILADRSDYDCMEYLIISYQLPKVEMFLNKLEDFLGRSGWILKKENIDIQQNKVIIQYIKDGIQAFQESMEEAEPDQDIKILREIQI